MKKDCEASGLAVLQSAIHIFLLNQRQQKYIFSVNAWQWMMRSWMNTLYSVCSCSPLVISDQSTPTQSWWKGIWVLFLQTNSNVCWWIIQTEVKILINIKFWWLIYLKVQCCLSFSLQSTVSPDCWFSETGRNIYPVCQK